MIKCVRIIYLFFIRVLYFSLPDEEYIKVQKKFEYHCCWSRSCVVISVHVKCIRGTCVYLIFFHTFIYFTVILNTIAKTLTPPSYLCIYICMYIYIYLHIQDILLIKVWVMPYTILLYKIKYQIYITLNIQLLDVGI